MDKDFLEDLVDVGEPGKWDINPSACIRELSRMEEEPGYSKTICGVHRKLWALLNIDLNGFIPQEKLDEVNLLLATAFRMGKRMDYRLQKYVLEKSLAQIVREVLHKEIHFKAPKNPTALSKKQKGKTK